MQSELVRQQKTLSKQAANAQRYEEIALTLADIKQQLSIQQLYQAKHNQQQQNLLMSVALPTLPPYKPAMRR